MRLIGLIICVFACQFSTLVRAGYEQPCYIDGCQSADGRFVITAKPVGQVTNHGPNEWQFVWQDTKENTTRIFDAKGVQGGQICAQLLIAPDGETFALFNHVTLWTEGKSDMHRAHKVVGDQPGVPKNKTDKHFSRRLIVYRNDGSIMKELAINDFLVDEEWNGVLAKFNRIDWLKPYPNLYFKTTPRYGYSFYRVSPDYTVLELLIAAPPGAKAEDGKSPRPPRTVRVSLTDGRILRADEKFEDKNKEPVRRFQGPDVLPGGGQAEKEGYIPSLDPVRNEGKLFNAEASPKTLTADSAPSAPSDRAAVPPTLELVKDGFRKLDTPAWLSGEKCLLVTDLEQKKLWRFDPPDKWTVVRDEACRGKIGPDGRFFGMCGGKLASWKPGLEPQVVVEKAVNDRETSLNDIAVGANGILYFTTLKDPDSGRLSVVDIDQRTVSVAFDGATDADLANPNGVAVSPDGKFLFVGISNYKNRSRSGVYRFPLREDGTLDVGVGKKEKWAPVSGPDGITVGPDGDTYIVAGSTVHIYSPDAQSTGTIRIPKDSGTNLTFGGEDGRTLFVTTNAALYLARIPAATQP